MGHNFPVWLKFKGGKGVLVGVSVFLGIDWKVFLCLIVIFAVVLAISKYVSLGSIIAAAPWISVNGRKRIRVNHSRWSSRWEPIPQPFWVP